MRSTLAVTLITTTLLSGCVFSISDDGINTHRANHNSWSYEYKQNREAIANIQLGESFEQVKAQFDTPRFTEQLNVNNETIQVLYYPTHVKTSDGAVTKDECTALVFKAGKLIGVGELALQNLLKS